MNIENIDIACNNFIQVFKHLLDKNIPLKKFPVTKNRDSKPWFTTGLRNACNKKNHLYKKFLKYQTAASSSKYKTYKNKLTTILRNAEKKYYSTLLKEKEKNIKATWKILNDLTKKNNINKELPREFKNGNKTMNNPKDIAIGFNNFFSNIGSDLASKIPQCNDGSFRDYINKNIPNSLFLNGVTNEEVIDEVRQFKGKYSCGVDGIDMYTVKRVIDEIVEPITYICNKSLETGIFPEAFKIAKIIPIYKSGNRQDFSNYRPVSLLPQFSKILEKLFNKRLMDFINKQELLFNGQFGFRPNMSTSDALLKLTEVITNEMDKANYTVGVFIDLKKAFDTIDHEILLKKLECYGIRGVAANWLKSYLTNRVQIVTVNNITSESANIKCGVPQGSILGPSLFLLYINDIYCVSTLLNCILFADDTNLIYSGKDLNRVCEIVSHELNKLSKWFAVNKLSLNVSKTNYIIFYSKNVPNETRVTINGKEIDRVYDIKFLGVHVDCKLNWKKHVEYIQTKISKNVYIIYTLKYILDKAVLFTLYNTLVLPYMTYCCEVWGNTYRSTLDFLFLLQKKVLRTVVKADFLSHTKPIFYDLQTLNIYDIIELKTAVVMFKAYHNLLPHSTQMYFKLNVNVHKYNTRQEEQFVTNYRRTTLKSMCLSNIGVKLWNNVPSELKKCKTTTSFKRLYKQKQLEMYIRDTE